MNELIFIPTAPGPPVDVTAYNTSSTSIRVTWKEIPPENENGVILGYHIFYKALPNENERKITVNDNTTLSANISGLEEYVEYNISVAAFISGEIGRRSDPVLVFTAEDGK